MSALPKASLDYVEDPIDHHVPRHITMTGHMNYHDYMAEKIAAKNERIDHLELCNRYLEDDITTYRVGVVGLLITLGIVLYQWLVVCNGQSPIGY